MTRTRKHVQHKVRGSGTPHFTYDKVKGIYIDINMEVVYSGLYSKLLERLV